MCPKGPGDPSLRRSSTGVHLYKYRPSPAGGGMIGFVAEYAYSFLATLRLVLRGPRGAAFDVHPGLQPAGHLLADRRCCSGALDRIRFVYDQHDLCPELYESRFADGAALPYKALLLARAATYRTADHVISTNESYRAVAITPRRQATQPTSPSCAPVPTRTRCAAAQPRPGAPPRPPLPRRLHRRDGSPGRRRPRRPRGATTSCTSSAATTSRFTLIGGGDCFDELRSAARRARTSTTTSTSPAGCPTTLVRRLMSTADIGLSPDPKNPLNDVSTMNKTMEYMAFELPVVAFDLMETRVSAERRRRLRRAQRRRAVRARRSSSCSTTTSARAPDGRGSVAHGSSRCWPGSTRAAPTSGCTTGCSAVSHVGDVAGRRDPEVCGIAGCYQRHDGSPLDRDDDRPRSRTAVPTATGIYGYEDG